MKHGQALFVDAHAVDEALRDASHSGPELAHLAAVYCDSPRALIFRSPSSDWRLLVLMLPLGSRLSLMANPIFSQLARTWGLGIRFIGVDRDHLVYDFRALLSDRTLELVVGLLARRERSLSRHDDATPDAPILDLLFDALAGDMLTTLERRRADWTRHLDREHVLEPSRTSGLFSHEDRHPDFLACLRSALREGIIAPDFYGRVLRSIDAREAAVDTRIASIIEDAMQPAALALLARATVGRHLGCYNWLALAPRHAGARAHLLTRVPALANFLADTLMPSEAWMRASLGTDPGPPDSAPREARPTPGFDLRPLIAQQANAYGSQWTALLRRAIDGGQDRMIIEALAARLGVSENLIRRLWREHPVALGQPPAWLLATVLRRLDQYPERAWPRDEAAWQQLIERASASQTG